MRRRGHQNGSTASDSRDGARIIRSSCRAASSSGSRSRARSRASRSSSWPTSRPAISTTRPASRSRISCSVSTASGARHCCSLRTIRVLRRAVRGGCRSPPAVSSATKRRCRRSERMPTLRLALRMLTRDWRAGELTVLIAAIVLAVGSVGTVAFFADRVKTALTRHANLLLGADVLVSGDRALPESLADEARRRGLATTPALKFNSMVQRAESDAGAPAVLADVKAVAPGYPLRGAILLVDANVPEGARASGIPPRGIAWPDARLAARLGVKAGDSITVGEATLEVGAIVKQEPEVASGLLSIGPRLLINLDDVPSTNLLQPGNRATWRLLVADLSNRDRLDPYLAWLTVELKPGQRMENVRDLRPEVRQTLERADQFLGLSSLVAVVLAAVAIALAASRYLRRHLDAAAMLRCFGASRRRTLALFVLQFAVVALAA